MKNVYRKTFKHGYLAIILLSLLVACSPKASKGDSSAIGQTEEAGNSRLDESGQLTDILEPSTQGPADARAANIYYGLFDQAGSSSVFEMCRDMQRFVRVRIDGKFISNVNPKPGGWRAYRNEHQLIKRSNTIKSRCPF
jgi:hypothetical protein